MAWNAGALRAGLPHRRRQQGRELERSGGREMALVAEVGRAEIVDGYVGIGIAEPCRFLPYDPVQMADQRPYVLFMHERQPAVGLVARQNGPVHHLTDPDRLDAALAVDRRDCLDVAPID